jgi:formylmethanofuran dehydrogenase subunit B
MRSTRDGLHMRRRIARPGLAGNGKEGTRERPRIRYTARVPPTSIKSRRPRPRLTEPWVRDGDRLRPAGWDEALDRAAQGLTAARGDGTRRFGMFSCSKATNEMNFVAQKFARVVMGSNNVDSCNRT